MGHILMLTTSYPSQVTGSGFPRGTFVEDFARLLANKGHKITVITHGENTILRKVEGINISQFKVSNKFIQISQNGIPEIDKNLRNGLSLLRYFIQFQFHIFKLLKTSKFSHIWAHWLIPLGIIAGLNGALFRIKYSITCYGAELIPFRENKSKIVKYILNIVCRKSSQIICISENTLDKLRVVSGFTGDYIPDPIDTLKFQRKQSDFRGNLPVGLDDFVIGFSGRMVERKGHRVLVEAANILMSKGYRNLYFVVGGDGPLRDNLEEMASSNRKCINFPGFIRPNEMIDFLNALDLYVLPSIVDARGDGEGSATAAFEAMACEVPTLVSYSAGNINAINENIGAWYFSEGNSNELALKIESLLINGDLLKQQGVAARNYVLAHYSWKAVENKIRLD